MIYRMLAVLVTVNLVACGSAAPPAKAAPRTLSVEDSARQYAETYGGNEIAYLSILTETDCYALREEWETAQTRRDSFASGTPEARHALGFVTVAYERMEAAGCY